MPPSEREKRARSKVATFGPTDYFSDRLAAHFAAFAASEVVRALEELKSEVERGHFDDLGDVYNWLDKRTRAASERGEK